MSNEMLTMLASVDNTNQLSKDLEDFYEKKKLYRDFILKYKPGQTFFQTRIDNKDVNCVLNFNSINNKFEIIGKDFDNNELFRKQIINDSNLDIINELEQTAKEISDSRFSSNIIKIENLFKTLNSIKDDPEKSQEEEEITANIRSLYSMGGKEYKLLLEKHKILSSIINDKQESLINNFTKSILETNNLQSLLSNNKVIGELSTLAPYLIYRSLIKGNNSINKNSLVITKENRDNFNIENILLIRDKFKPNQIIDDETDINLISFYGVSNVRKFKDLIFIKDLNVHSLGEISRTVDLRNLSEITYSDGKKMFNYINQLVTTIDKDYTIDTSKANYLFSYSTIKKLSEKESTSQKEPNEPELINYYPTIDLELNMNNIFMFYSKSRHSKYGKGARESIKDDNEDFILLDSISDWRKKLSNFYIFTSESGNIYPIVIDDKKFASVEHYFHYSKFIDSDLDLSEEHKHRYNIYANKFLLDGEFGRLSGDSVKRYGGVKSGYNIPNKWSQIQSSGLKFRDEILLKGLFAKAKQFEEIKTILLATKDSLIIHPQGGNVRSKNNEYATVHMLVRKSLSDGQDELPNYDTEKVVSDVQSSIDIRSQIEEIDIESKRSAQAKLDTIEKVSTPESSDSSSQLSVVSERSEEDSESPQSEEQQRQLPDLITQELETAKSLLADKDVDIQGFSNNKILFEAGLIKSIENNKYSEDMASLQEYKESLALEGVINHIPPDGNCLFYSVVEAMKKQNIFPMNFIDGSEDGQYSSNTDSLLLIAGDKSLKGDIHKDASIELRDDVSTKILLNLGDSELIESNPDTTGTYLISIMSDYDTTLEDYVEKIKKDARDDVGLWGGDIELKAISALFNINITVLSSGKYTINYIAETLRQHMPKGPEFNTSNNETIYLGFLENSKHYVLIADSKVVIEDLSAKEKIRGYKYFEHNVTHPTDSSKTIPVKCVIVFNDDEDLPPQILGLYNSSKGTIEMEADSDSEVVADAYKAIIKELNNYVESADLDEDSLIDIEYMRDITDGKVYWINENREEILVGRFEGDYVDEDGDRITDKMIAFNTDA